MGYLDLTNSFLYKDPVFRAKLDALGENDAYLKANGWQNSTKAVFFQASAPTGWTKDTTNNAKALRVVSGVTGGTTGGTKDISTVVSLTHTAHSIASQSDHTHKPSGPNGSHNHTIIDVFNTATGKTSFAGYLIGTGDTPIRTVSNGASTSTKLVPFLDYFDPSVDEYDESSVGGAHTHNNVTTTSALTDLTLKYVDVIVCSKDSSSGYTDMTTAFVSGDKITYQDLDKLAESDKFLYGRLTPSGSIMPFGQASAPTGWTKATSHDDKALRVVSGTGGGSGGDTGFGSSINLTHNHTTNTEGAHTHTMGAHRHHMATQTQTSMGLSAKGHVSSDGSSHLWSTTDAAGTLTCVRGRTLKDGGGGTLASSGSHSHTIGSSLTTIQMAYLDVILCSKDSSGAGSVYTDMSAVWINKILVSKQRLNKMAANDDYLLFHTVEAGSKTFFSMASPPTGWTKLLTVDDKGLRVVSGGSGGTTGGSQSISSVVSLAHTHTIANASHSHTEPSHHHTLQTYSESNAGSLLNPIADQPAAQMEEESGTSRTIFPINNFSQDQSGSTTGSYPVLHNHGGTTGSLLTDITFAYQDVLYCSKD